MKPARRHSRYLAPLRAVRSLYTLIESRSDAPVAMAFAGRAAQLLAAPITLLLIARRFSPDTQGYYYTFSSLLALQTFVELGFSYVIVNMASHEWADLSLSPKGELIGDPVAHARLASLVRLVMGWYAVAASVFWSAVSAGGLLFLSRASASDHLSWRAPWLGVVALTSVTLWLTPLIAVLDGCNQYGTTNQFRLVQAVLASVATWVAISSGAELWTAVVAAAVATLTMAALVAVRYRPFFLSLLSEPAKVGMNWRSEIWPMQWRMALGGVVNYFVFSMFSPVMFAYYGPVVAGQMGMTLAAIRGAQMLGSVWIDTKVAEFGILIARRDFVRLDRLFWRRTQASLLVVALASGGLVSLLIMLRALKHPFALRLLGPGPTALLLAGTLMSQVGVCLSSYLRAHKREPLAVVSVATGMMTGSAVWLLGRRFGPLGAAAGSAGTWIVSTVWVWRIFLHSRREWHADVTPAAAVTPR